MRCSLLHSREPGEGEITRGDRREAGDLWCPCGRGLQSTAVLAAGEELQFSHATTTVSQREGALQVVPRPSAVRVAAGS